MATFSVVVVNWHRERKHGWPTQFPNLPIVQQLPPTSYQNYGPTDTNDEEEEEEEEDPFGGYRRYPPQHYQPSYPNPRVAQPGAAYPGGMTRERGTHRFSRSLTQRSGAQITTQEKDKSAPWQPNSQTHT